MEYSYSAEFSRSFQSFKKDLQRRKHADLGPISRTLQISRVLLKKKNMLCYLIASSFLRSQCILGIYLLVCMHYVCFMLYFGASLSYFPPLPSFQLDSTGCSIQYWCFVCERRCINQQHTFILYYIILLDISFTDCRINHQLLGPLF